MLVAVRTWSVLPKIHIHGTISVPRSISVATPDASHLGQLLNFATSRGACMLRRTSIVCRFRQPAVQLEATRRVAIKPRKPSTKSDVSNIRSWNSLFWTNLRDHASCVNLLRHACMEKTIYSQQYALMLHILRDARRSAGLSQEQLASRLHVTQAFVSKCERGQRRIDPVELRAWCAALGTTGVRFYEIFEEAASKNETLLGKKF